MALYNLLTLCSQEQPKLDDDEDRQNPAYIPRRGAFYEHDMRLDPDDKEAVEPEKEEKRFAVKFDYNIPDIKVYYVTIFTYG